MNIIKLKQYIGDDILCAIPGCHDIIEINGKEYKGSWFKPGNTETQKVDYSKRDTSGLHAVTIERKMCSAKTVKDFRVLLGTVHLERANKILCMLPDEEFMKVYMDKLLPFFMPKIAAVEFKSNENKVYDITELQETHTITVKDMRSGMNYKIQD